MNQKVLCGLTATLLMTTLGLPFAQSAQSSEAVDQGSEANLKASSQPSPTGVIQSQEAVKVGEQQSPAAAQPSSATALNPKAPESTRSNNEVVKLGERDSQTGSATDADSIVAKVQAHTLSGRKAATLYVRNIPVLTFVSGAKTTTEAVKMGSRQPEAQSSDVAIETKSLNATDSPTADSPQAPSTAPESASTEADADLSQDDPVWRAAAIAARLNRLNRDGLDAQKITVSWNAAANKAGKPSYAIKADKHLLALVDAHTMLPDSTRNLETDALQATNRLRRLLGNAKPLSGVSGKPRWSQQIAMGPIRFQLSGLASWYGPGFNGSPSASGEIFNQNALTAAHRTLPFGTQVLVTNLSNGLSVVVRINDRGPYSGDRIIDLSAAAARVLGVMQTGVAPVRLDVLDNSGTITAGN